MPPLVAGTIDPICRRCFRPGHAGMAGRPSLVRERSSRPTQGPHRTGSIHHLLRPSGQLKVIRPRSSTSPCGDGNACLPEDVGDDVGDRIALGLLIQREPLQGLQSDSGLPGGRALSVVNAKPESEAQPWAAEYCSKQGLLPSFKGMSMPMRSVSADYECVASAAATAPGASAPGPTF